MIFRVIGLQGIFFFSVVFCVPRIFSREEVLFFCTWKAKAFKETGKQWKLPQPGLQGPPNGSCHSQALMAPRQPPTPAVSPNESFISLGFGVQRAGTPCPPWASAWDPSLGLNTWGLGVPSQPSCLGEA